MVEKKRRRSGHFSSFAGGKALAVAAVIFFHAAKCIRLCATCVWGTSALEIREGRCVRLSIESLVAASKKRRAGVVCVSRFECRSFPSPALCFLLARLLIPSPANLRARVAGSPLPSRARESVLSARSQRARCPFASGGIGRARITREATAKEEEERQRSDDPPPQSSSSTKHTHFSLPPLSTLIGNKPPPPIAPLLRRQDRLGPGLRKRSPAPGRPRRPQARDRRPGLEVHHRRRRRRRLAGVLWPR